MKPKANVAGGAINGAHATRKPGEISPGCLFTISEVRERLQLGAWAWRKLIRAGLPVIRIGDEGS